MRLRGLRWGHRMGRAIRRPMMICLVFFGVLLTQPAKLQLYFLPTVGVGFVVGDSVINGDIGCDQGLGEARHASSGDLVVALAKNEHNTPKIIQAAINSLNTVIDGAGTINWLFTGQPMLNSDALML